MRGRVLVWLLALAAGLIPAGASFAEEPPTESSAREPGPRMEGRLDFAAGLGFHGDDVQSGADHVESRGTALDGARLSGALFASSTAFGLAAHLELERYQLRGVDPVQGAINTPVTSFDGGLALAWHTRLGGGAHIEAQAGYDLWHLPVPVFAGGAVDAGAQALAHGPLIAALVDVPLGAGIAVELGGRATPFGFSRGADGASLATRRFAVDARALYDAVHTQDFALSAFVGYLFETTHADGGQLVVDRNRQQLALGLRASFGARPREMATHVAAVAKPVRAQPHRRRIVGALQVAETGDGTDADLRQGIALHVDAGERGRDATSDAEGQFVLDDVPAGLVTVKIERDGLKAKEEVISVPEAGDVKVDIVVHRAAAVAPATVVGNVRSDQGTAVAAEIRVQGGGKGVRANERGQFQLSLPPGRYEILISAEGFIEQRKTLEARAGQQSIFNIDLHRHP